LFKLENPDSDPEPVPPASAARRSKRVKLEVVEAGEKAYGDGCDEELPTLAAKPLAGKGKGKGKKAEGEGEGEGDGEEEDYSALQALILKKRQNAGAFLDDLAAKYADRKPRAKGKRKKDATSDEVDESPKKKRRGAELDPGTLDDDDDDDDGFAKSQQKDKGAEVDKSTGKSKRAGRTRKP